MPGSDRPSFYDAELNPFFPHKLFGKRTCTLTYIYVHASVQKNNKDTRAIMKTSRRRASAIITGSQPYNLLRA